MKNLYLSLILFFCFCKYSSAQQVQWTTVAPTANSILGSDGLFIQLMINDAYSFQDGTIQTMLDGQPINTLIRVSGHKLSIIYEGILPDGKHIIEVKARIPEVGRMESTSWIFYVNRQDAGLGAAATKSNSASNTTLANTDKASVTGTLTADNRNEIISGSGAALRQEPLATRTVNLDLTAKIKDITIPVKIFSTSDTRFTEQSPNFYSVGFRRKWLEAEVGDMNPAIDKLVLTGVRMRGGRLMMKSKTASMQLFYGYMSQSYEGQIGRAHV